MARVRVGIIGLSASDVAWVSRSHGMALQKAPLSAKYQLTAIATASAESAAASAARWGIPPEKAYTKAEDIAADPDVDLVVVGVKLPLHYDLTLPALKAGKDVFVEWPLATDMNQVKELQAAAKRGGGRVIVGLQARASPSILKVGRAFSIAKRGAFLKVMMSLIKKKG